MKFLLLFCFLCSLAAGGVDFLRLKPDFSRSDWRELLIPSGAGEPSVRGNALELPPGSLLATQRFPLVKGEIKIKAGVLPCRQQARRAAGGGRGLRSGLPRSGEQ